MHMSMGLHIGMELKSAYQEAMDLYAASPLIKVDVPLDNLVLNVPAALIEEDELSAIFGGERYAGTIGGRFFITGSVPEQYKRFAAFHELAEHAAPRGFDVTGKAKHFQALALELAYAKVTLSEDEFQAYVEWRKSVERTNFFRLSDDGLVDRLAVRMEEVFRSMPDFLTYRNKQLIEVKGKTE